MGFLSGILGGRQRIDLTGLTDWHCHILPGVDDGVQTLDESLAILSDYEAAGISEVWLTPHIMEDIPNTPADLGARFDELRRAYSGPVRLNLAAEHMLDSLFAERLKARELMPFGGDGRTLLVETSYFGAPIGLNDTIDAIRAAGYHPLLAHPERYNYIDSLKAYRALCERGVRFQLNLMSLSGHYGPAVKEKALQLLKAGMYSRVGSDLHRRDHLRIIRGMALTRPVLVRLIDTISQS